MAALADWDAYLAAIRTPRNVLPFYKAGATMFGSESFNSSWLTSGAAPTTAAVPASDDAGALGQVNAGGGQLLIPSLTARMDAAINGSSGVGVGFALLCDRLSHQGGLVGNVATVQTTNLPTAALTRYTSGVGVMAALEIYTQIGTTLTTVSVSYTDSDGNAANTSPLRPFGAGLRREVRAFLPIPLASGDKGVRSVESVTVTATTGTAGAFGVTLFKPLLMVPLTINRQEQTIANGIIGGLPEVLDDASLFWLIKGYTSVSPSLHGALSLAEV